MKKHEGLNVLYHMAEDYPSEEQRKASSILLAAGTEGIDADRICKKTGYSHNFVRTVIRRMRTSGLWDGDKVNWRKWVADLDDPYWEFGSFWRDSMVAAGMWTARNVKSNLTIYEPPSVAQ